MAKKKTLGILPAEQEAAMKYFAMSNAALLHLAKDSRITDIHQAYDYISAICQSETGVSLDEEKQSWKKDVLRATPTDYVATEWQRVRSDWGFIS